MMDKLWKALTILALVFLLLHIIVLIIQIVGNNCIK